MIITECVSKLIQHFRNICASFFRLDSYTDVLRVDSSDKFLGQSERLTLLNNNFLPPALEVDVLEISFRSWSRPVVSALFQGIKVNLVLQKGISTMNIPFQISGNSHHRDGDELCPIDESSGDKRTVPPVLIGGMTIHEALKILPKPPKEEGLYPRIGVLNVTNTSIAIFSTDGDSSPLNSANNSTSSLSLLAKIQVPDSVFFPILHITEGKNHR